jgi:putative endonuclease
MYLYLLENISIKKYYVGITSDLERRLQEHNTQGLHFTGKMEGNWEIVGYKEMDEKKARTEEIRLKKAKNRKYIYWYFVSKGS